MDYQNAKPLILIGADNGKLCLPIETRECKWGEPVAINTRLGWSVHGNQYQTKVNQSTVHHSFHVCTCNNENDLHSIVEKFFAIENFGIERPIKMPESVDSARARRLLEETTIRVEGRFRTELLWRVDNVTMPNSLPMVRRRLLYLVRKIASNPDLAINLHSQIASYIENGYARKLSRTKPAMTYPRTWYFPVFAVTNPNKPDKIRMVWDAAAKVHGMSLNSVLLKGPDQLALLTQILWFRERRIAKFIQPTNMHNFREPDVLIMQVSSPLHKKSQRH